jgi:hypothetical protein
LGFFFLVIEIILEEPNCHINIYLQVRLLREGKEVPPELEQRLTKSKSQSKEVGKGENSDTQTDDIKILNEKVIHVYKFDGKLISEKKLDIFLNYILFLSIRFTSLKFIN